MNKLLPLVLSILMTGCATSEYQDPSWYTVNYDDGVTTVGDVAVGAVIVVGVIVTAGALLNAVNPPADNNTYVQQPESNDSQVARELCRARLERNHMIGTC